MPINDVRTLAEKLRAAEHERRRQEELEAAKAERQRQGRRLFHAAPERSADEPEESGLGATIRSSVRGAVNAIGLGPDGPIAHLGDVLRAGMDKRRGSRHPDVDALRQTVRALSGRDLAQRRQDLARRQRAALPVPGTNTKPPSRVVAGSASASPTTWEQLDSAVGKADGTDRFGLGSNDAFNDALAGYSPGQANHEQKLHVRGRMHDRNMAAIDPERRDTSLTEKEQARVNRRLQNRGQVDELSNLNPLLVALAGKSPEPNLSASGGTSLDDALKARREKFGEPIIAGRPVSRTRTSGGEPIPFDSAGQPMVKPGMDTGHLRHAGGKEYQSGMALRQSRRGNEQARAKDKAANRAALRTLKDALAGEQAEERNLNAVLREAYQQDQINAQNGIRSDYFGKVSANISSERQRAQNERFATQDAEQKNKQMRMDALDKEQAALVAAANNNLVDAAQFNEAIAAIQEDRDNILGRPARQQQKQPLNAEQLRLQEKGDAVRETLKTSQSADQSARRLVKAVRDGKMTQEAAELQLAQEGEETSRIFKELQRKNERNMEHEREASRFPGIGIGVGGL